MSGSESDHNPDSSEAGTRPYVVAYIQKPVYNVGDKVYLLNSGGSREGPYLIASLPTTSTCTLSHEDGRAVQSNKEISVDYVEAA